MAPRFEIKKWNAVAMWSWDICADTVRRRRRRRRRFRWAIHHSTLQHAVRCWEFSDTVGLFSVATSLAKCCICTVRHLSQFAQRAQH
jgi:hypothetical protein